MGRKILANDSAAAVIGCRQPLIEPQTAKSDTGAARSIIRRWLAYITLLITSLVLLGDMVYLLYTFLEGGLTLRALLKAASVAIVAGLVFLYYKAEVAEVSQEG